MNVKPALLFDTFTVVYAGHSLEDFKPNFAPDDYVFLPNLNLITRISVRSCVCGI